jgi:hypothetical protein
MQRSIMRWLIPCLFLLTCSAVLSAPPLPKPLSPEEAAQQAILYLADQIETEDVPNLAQKIVREHASENISSVFRFKRKGGLGTGILPEQQDGIERVLLKWQRKGPSRAELEKYHVEALRMAALVRAMSELAPLRMAVQPLHPKVERKQLDEVVREFQSAAREFHAAVAANDPLRVNQSATRLGHTCCDCHGLLRDF